MEKYRIILASASPRRRELLHQIGLKPEIVPSQIEENITGVRPDQVVMELSRQKAEDVATAYTGEQAVVIGADTVVSLENNILGKPHSQEEAWEMLSRLSGTGHQVYTGVTVINCRNGKSETFAEKTDVFVYPMEEEEIRRYIATKDPMDKAGAYGIQGQFAAYIKEIRGDYTNVVGLPVGRVYQTLKKIASSDDQA